MHAAEWRRVDAVRLEERQVCLVEYSHHDLLAVHGLMTGASPTTPKRRKVPPEPPETPVSFLISAHLILEKENSGPYRRCMGAVQMV